MSAKSDHRAGVFAAARNDMGLVRCAAIGIPDAGPCENQIQAAHYIGCSELRTQQIKMLVSGYRFADDDPRHKLTEVTLDQLWADPRNGLALCYGHHEVFDGKRPPKRLHIPPPQSVIDFCNEYGLEHLLEPASNAA